MTTDTPSTLYQRILLERRQRAAELRDQLEDEARTDWFGIGIAIGLVIGAIIASL